MFLRTQNVNRYLNTQKRSTRITNNHHPHHCNNNINHNYIQNNDYNAVSFQRKTYHYYYVTNVTSTYSPYFHLQLIHNIQLKERRQFATRKKNSDEEKEEKFVEEENETDFEKMHSKEIEKAVNKWIKKREQYEDEHLEKDEEDDYGNTKTERKFYDVDEVFLNWANKRMNESSSIRKETEMLTNMLGLDKINIRLEDKDEIFGYDDRASEEDLYKRLDDPKLLKSGKFDESRLVIKDEPIDENMTDKMFIKEFFRGDPIREYYEDDYDPKNDPDWKDDDDDFDYFYEKGEIRALQEQQSEDFEYQFFDDEINKNSRKSLGFRNTGYSASTVDYASYKRSKEEKTKAGEGEEKNSKYYDPNEVFFPDDTNSDKRSSKQRRSRLNEDEDEDEEEDDVDNMNNDDDDDDDYNFTDDLNKGEKYKNVDDLTYLRNYQTGVIPPNEMDKDFAPRIRSVDGESFIDGFYIPDRFYQFVLDEKKYLEQHPRSQKFDRQIAKHQKRMQMEETKRRKRRAARKTFGENNLTARQLSVGAMVLSELETTLDHYPIFLPFRKHMFSIEDVVMSKDLLKARVYWNCRDGRIKECESLIKKLYSQIRKHFARRNSGMKASPIFIFIKPDPEKEKKAEKFAATLETAVRDLDEEIQIFEKKTGTVVD